MIHVITRSEQSLFFTSERDEDERALQPGPLGAEHASQFEHARRSRGIIVRAVMYFAGTGCEATFAATAKMIVVRADDNVFVLQNRIRAFEHADDVVSRNFVTNDVGGERDLSSQDSVVSGRLCGS